MSEEKVKTPRAPNPDARNGVSPPKEGTVSAAIWAVLDDLPEEQRTAKFVADALGEGVNKATVNTQVARWRAYNGLTTPRPPKDE